MAHRRPRVQSADESTLATLQAEAKRSGKRLTDLPPTVVREAQKRGFPDMRSIIVPPSVIQESLTEPLLGDLLVTRIGYCSRATGHYIPRPEGSLDHILIYCVAGQGWVHLGKHVLDIPKDTMLCVPQGIPHTYGATPEKPWSNYWIHFTGHRAPDYFAALRTTPTDPLLHLACTAEILSAFEATYGHMADVHTPQNLLAAGTALARFLGLVQLRRSAVGISARSTEQHVQETVQFMAHNLNRSVTVRELAQLANLGVSRYETLFLKLTGSSPILYLNQMRIQRACRLLTETDQPAKNIAAAIGMEDPYYFSRLFKKLVGQSPAHFRKQRDASFSSR